MPKPIVRLLMRWYMTQRMRVQWSDRASEYFGISNGVHQGGILSPVLYTIYLDSLLETLCSSGRGCYWENHFSGALCCADYLTILAPSPDAHRKMLTICEEFAQTHGIVLNASKTQIICFRHSAASVPAHFSLCGQHLPLVDSVVHLGNTLQYNLSTNWTFNQNQ